MAQKISDAALARNVSSNEIPENLLYFADSAYFDIELEGGYSGKKTVSVSEGASITFDGIPVGTSVYAVAKAYRYQNSNSGDSSEQIELTLYLGKSQTITVKEGSNTISILMQDPLDYFCPSGFVTVNGTTISESVSNSSLFISGRSITIPDMYVCDHETTQAEYEKYCAYGATTSGRAPSECKYGANYPAYNVSWYDAIVYCNLRSIAEGLNPVYYMNDAESVSIFDPRLWDGIIQDGSKYRGPDADNEAWNSIHIWAGATGYRLPTAAEWEYIARGGNAGIPSTQTSYPGSNTLNDVAWYSGNSDDHVHEVKGKLPNTLGIYDLAGNVLEWYFDWYSSSITASTGSTGESSGSYRAYANASFWDSSSNRFYVYWWGGYAEPKNREYNLGLRVVRDAY